MTKKQNSKQYDLEDRTLEFARRVVSFCKRLPKSAIDGEICKQLVRSATSVGANYIEANEALSKRDFSMRIKICRKEAKESGYWLRLIEVNISALKNEQEKLLQESMELTRIFGAITIKSQ
jgi:four helix bundle protein